ncbi:MAG: DNA-directed RNA polymerase subunit beta [Deltaproteobacteria bacterium]|nr:DNA-directed RNA polymerase subunit beta [Deltaproteobacteria bacterium]MCL5791701.1 DNA-directed RNA polymerase subunit beta [Deltaproteobacteria bacterium]
MTTNVYDELSVSRKDFRKFRTIMDIPNLIEVQVDSFNQFLQADVKPEERKNIGLQAAFNAVLPIKDYNDTASVEFVKYILDPPTYTEDECREKSLTYTMPIKILVRLILKDIDPETKTKTIRDIKEQEVYFGDIPIMTTKGTFIINGIERVIINQLHRSPGVFFEYDKLKIQSIGRPAYIARIIPYEGSWLDFEFDPKNIMYVKVDKRKKFYATVLLKALGYTDEDILRKFYKTEAVKIKNNVLTLHIDYDLLLNRKFFSDIIDPSTGDAVVPAGTKITRNLVRRIISRNIKTMTINYEDIDGMVSVGEIKSRDGRSILKCNQGLDKDIFKQILEEQINKLEFIYFDNISVGSDIRETLLLDKITNQQEAIEEFYSKLRPNESYTPEITKSFFEDMFFSKSKYNLTNVGRLKINKRLGTDTPLDITVLTRENIIDTAKHLFDLKNGRGDVDDIDHLSNRRVRTVGELLENQFKLGLLRMAKTVKEKFTHDLQTLMPSELVNPKPVIAAIKEFFGGSQLSQFMDQTNPLAELTHKRRLSALGPGGLTRERAGFEVRDVHSTHYGRICPIETPEGPNIGLIASMSTYAKVDEFGFLRTPYRIVKNGVVKNEIIYVSAIDEEDKTIAQMNTQTDEENKIIDEYVAARRGGEFIMVHKDEVDYMDVSPTQLVSVAAALIPFLEHDDANRALMGSNMQRQAVPLIKTEAPIIATGMERYVGRNSGAIIIAEEDGIITSVDAKRIVVQYTDKAKRTNVKIYNLHKFQKSNQGTCLNQIPAVKASQKIKRGDILADGAAVSGGELALGKNVLVAFMPWNGYNYEDSILVNERINKDDVFTSIHIEEYECSARELKLGREEITRDIPNVSDEALKDIDESGIVRIGAEVKPGDILVGKITPKGESQPSPEEKLLKAIFGDKAGDVKDTSLRVKPGVHGIVVDVKIFSRKSGSDKDKTKDQELLKLQTDQEEELSIIDDTMKEQMKKLLVGEKIIEKFNDDRRKISLKKGAVITEEIVDKLPVEKWVSISLLENGKLEEKVKKIVEATIEQKDMIKAIFEQKINRLKKGDELPIGVFKLVKVYIATKRKLFAGDKMAGRHGNKGVVSKIVPEEDMPFLPDGRAVDIVLNPLGVPSRLNVGQILETHLGWSARAFGEQIQEFIDEHYSAQKLKGYLKDIYKNTAIAKHIDKFDDKEVVEFAKTLTNGIKMSTEVFNGATEKEIKDMLKLANLPENGQITLYDGKSGEPFRSRVTVGVMYMMKLHHLVEEKIHARSTGPYSLVTQQPLGGKAQFGGQRLGEMEVWALEAYGAAYTLQEMLTVKSDDIPGRTRIFDSIVKGRHNFEPGIPESFNVMVRELKSLGLNIELIEKEQLE